MTVYGTDVSHHQDPTRCDWPTAYAAGLRFAYVKGSEGMDDGKPYVDESAAEHIARIRQTPVHVGMYHFARPDNRFKTCIDGRTNGVNEGEFAASTAISLGLAWRGSLPVAIDLEKYTDDALGITDAQRDDFVRGMVDTLECRLGRLPTIYAGATFWGYQHSSALAAELRARGVLLWMVNYGEGPDPSKSIAGWPWSMWQHSGGGDYCYAEAFPGLPHPIDQNVYRGTMAELRGLVG
jgi:GH25 family lysozyme M1 (1,4-beta-N-acetylmuramidase)